MKPTTEQLLSALFDYQRFENDPTLAQMIAETEHDCDGELSDDALLMVNAAGEATVRPNDEGKPL